MGIFPYLEDTEYGYKDMGEIGHIYLLFTENNELPDMVLFMPFENNVRNFHHYLEYSEFFEV
jgi:hypothetical protein